VVGRRPIRLGQLKRAKVRAKLSSGERTLAQPTAFLLAVLSPPIEEGRINPLDHLWVRTLAHTAEVRVQLVLPDLIIRPEHQDRSAWITLLDDLVAEDTPLANAHS
jgi:hypothetical protein